jgi:hypothetical protein
MERGFHNAVVFLGGVHSVPDGEVVLLQQFIFLILKTGFWRGKYLQFFSNQGINFS